MKSGCEEKIEKVLVICNTVSKAQKLYKKLEGENVWLLHSKYIESQSISGKENYGIFGVR